MSTTQRTKTLFSGSFNKSRPMRLVMWSVLKEKKVNFGVLKINSPEHNIEGEIGVMWGLFLIGGCLLGRRERGYDAIKLLFTLPSGDFEYVDYGVSEPIGLDEGLKIRLTDLVSVWPNLPEQMENLNSRTSRNKMRQLTRDPELKPVVAKVTAAKVTADKAHLQGIDQNVLQQLLDFDRKTMHLRAAAFWGAAVVFSSIATMIGFLQH